MQEHACTHINTLNHTHTRTRTHTHTHTHWSGWLLKLLSKGKTGACQSYTKVSTAEWHGARAHHVGGPTHPHTHTHTCTNGVWASQIERDTPLSFSSIPQGNHTLTPLPSLFFHPLPRLFSFFSAFYSSLYSSLHSLMLYYHKGRTANWMDRERIALKHTNNAPKTHWDIKRGMKTEKEVHLYHQGYYLLYTTSLNLSVCLSVCLSICLSTNVAVVVVDKLSITHAASLSCLCTHVLI